MNVTKPEALYTPASFQVVNLKYPSQKKEGSERLSKSREEVSAARARFFRETNFSQSKPSPTPVKSTKPISRSKDFSRLLEKFSQSDISSTERSNTDSAVPHCIASDVRQTKKLFHSSDGGNDVRMKTPVRSTSLKLRDVKTGKEKDTTDRVQRSVSLRAKFAGERAAPDPSMASSSEVVLVPSKKQEEVMSSDEKTEDKRGGERSTCAEQYKETTFEEVIADSKFTARRKETDSSIHQYLSSEMDLKSTDKTGHVDPSSHPKAQELHVSAHSIALDTIVCSNTDHENPTVSSHSVEKKIASEKISVIHSSFHSTITLSKESRSTENTDPVRLRSPTCFVSSNIEPLVSEQEESPSQSELDAVFTPDTMSKDIFIGLVGEDSEQIRVVHKSTNNLNKEVEKASPTESSSESKSENPLLSLGHSISVSTTTAATPPGVSSVSSESLEQRRGILKRTPSLPKQESDPSIDPQLFKIMQQRRQLEQQMKAAVQDDDMPSAGLQRQRALSAAEEIENNVRQMREEKVKKKSEQTVEEAELCMSVTERILKMQNKIVERQLSTGPRARPGAATPVSAKSQSGTVTPQKHHETVSKICVSVSSEGVCSRDLMEKLSVLASQSTEVEERCQRLQRKQRNNCRFRTQPVTLDELREADSLDSVGQFRALVRRNASKSIFDQLNFQAQGKLRPTRNTEFPQHLAPEKRRRRDRYHRYKTLPVTAKELNAIPEGEPLVPMLVARTLEVCRQDSHADSGILSGSEAESLPSESLRNLSLEMDVSESDPSRMSVTSKAALFRSLDEKARAEREKEKSASGAKRYIDRKKRERSRTQPVTDDEVKTAAVFAEEKKMVSVPVKFPQPEVINRPKSPSLEHDSEEDQLVKLSLSEKVKLFSNPKEKLSDGDKSTRVGMSAPRRRQRAHTSRFNTQPVTPEELEKASRISPLAMSLVKPPDTELLIGLRIKDQQELMMIHAEATLSQCSSHSGSRASSQPGSRRDSFTTADILPISSENTSLESRQTLSITLPLLEQDTRTVKAATEIAFSPQTPAIELTRGDSEPRGILKKMKSTESVSDGNTFRILHNEMITETTQTVQCQGERAIESQDSTEPPNAECVHLESHGDSSATQDKDKLVSKIPFSMWDEGTGGQSSTDIPESGKNTESKRRSRLADRKTHTERYLTQPALELTHDQSSQSKRKFKYEGRHLTQPITPDEMKEAESSATTYGITNVSGGSIADRLNQLKVSGEENWKKRASREKIAEMGMPTFNQKKEKQDLPIVQPATIASRLSQLEASSETWRERIEETDAKQFAVASKISKVASAVESPLVAKLRASKQDLMKLDYSSNCSSPVSSPSTPVKEFLCKIPLPKDIIAGPSVIKKLEECGNSREGSDFESGNENTEAIHIEVPVVNDEEINQFFATKEITDIADKVDLNIDDFNNIFVESSDILQTVRKIRPLRKKKASGHNPLKTVTQFVEVQTAYVQVTSGVVKKELRRLKIEGLAHEAARAGLASIENFSKVELRKTEPSIFPAALGARHNPFCDLMLLHVKGRRNVQTRLVAPLAKSINAGDCYILITPKNVINWIGQYSNIIEKAKAAEIAIIIQQKKDLCFRETTPVASIEQAKDHLGAGKIFWASLGGVKEVQACGPDEEDELYESSIIKTNMVYRLVDNTLQPYHQYWGSIPRYEMLQEKEVIIFDFGSEFYVWQGKAVNMEHRKQGMALAKKLWEKGYDYSECAISPMCPLHLEEQGGIPSKSLNRPDWTIFGKINQNMETILFREKFGDWPDSARLIGVKTTKTLELKTEFADIRPYDALKMIPIPDTPVTMLLDGAHVGRGKKWQEDMQGFTKEQDIITLGIRVWHVQEYDHCCLPETSYGQFHCGDTYVVRWQYMITNAGLRSLKGHGARHSLTGRERCAYFFWQGQDSSINEKGASALMTVELDEERGPQVRVVQGKEPPCFLNLFEGRMIVHIGKREDPATNTQGQWRMYHIRNDDPGEICLLEIYISIVNLRSRTSLILLNVLTGVVYIWHGCKTPKHIRALALLAVQNIKEKRPLELFLHSDAPVTVREVEEGEENSEIWSALGERDRGLYHSMMCIPDVEICDATPRLFYMSSVSMMFEVTEQLNPARLPSTTTPFPFLQSDLYRAPQPALFLLDVGHTVYLWQGWWPVGSEEVKNIHTGSAQARYNHDRKCAMETTLHYYREQKQKGVCHSAYLIYAGAEPLVFQNLFPYWEADSTVQELARKEGRTDGHCEPVEDFYARFAEAQYSLLQLQDRPLPDGVDPLRLETYLSDEEFEEVFDMKKDDFYKLPAWKQNQLKQSLGLY